MHLTALLNCRQNLKRKIERIVDHVERVEAGYYGGNSFGSCAHDERLQRRQQLYFIVLDRLNLLIDKAQKNA